MLRCRLVTFDVVNTILKVIGSPGHQYAEVAALYGLHINDKDIMKIYRPMYTQMKKDYPTYGIFDNLSTKQWWTIFVRRVFKSIGHGTNEELLIKMTDSLWERFSEGANWQVLPHSKDILEQLKGEGFKLGVVSNFDERLENTLKKQGLHAYFDVHVTAVSARAEKPDPRTFMSALNQVEVPPEQSVHIGDDIYDDYFGAKRVGMNALLLDTSAKLHFDCDKYGVLKQDILTDIRQLPDRVVSL